MIESDETFKRLKLLEKEIDDIQNQRVGQQMELDTIENMALKQRFQAIIDDLKMQEAVKKAEYEELSNMLKNST